MITKKDQEAAWHLWRKVAPPSAQIVLDHAIEQHLNDQSNMGFWWVRKSIGQKAMPPEIFSAVAPEKLLACDGDVSKIGFIPEGEVECPEFLTWAIDFQKLKQILMPKFKIGVAPVSQKLYRNVMSGNIDDSTPSQKDAIAVGSVRYIDCLRFCNKLNQIFGLDNVYEIKERKKDNTYPIIYADFRKNGFRLPLNKEWIKAARAGNNHKYSGGDDPHITGLRDRENQVWNLKTNRPNAFGLYDMTGHVAQYVEPFYNHSDILDQRRIRYDETQAFMIHGGYTFAEKARPISDSYYMLHNMSEPAVGFRIARNA